MCNVNELTELWPLDGFDGRYSITRDARIWSHVKGIWMKPSVVIGYFAFNLTYGKPHKQKMFMLHRLMAKTFLGLKQGDYVDHKDCNKKNSVVSNLRICAKVQNEYNKGPSKRNISGVKGVSWDEKRGKFSVRMAYGGRNMFLGRFTSKEDAATAYAKAAEIYHREFTHASTVR